MINKTTNCRGLLWFNLWCLVVLAVGPEAVAQEHRYVGVASCSSSNCHGSVSPLQGSNVLQNEYTSWQEHDLHSKAYLNLTGPEAKRIGQHLGLDAPEREKLCLDCHATNAPAELRDTKFQLEDGVGCESCHGAGSGYLQSHAGRGQTHAQNVEAGLKDIVAPSKRAELCVTCHLGNEEKAVTHRLIGAGHPRLSFEVDTFSMIEPKHWVVDEDYRQRKGDYISAKAWLTGQIENAKTSLALLTSNKRNHDGIWPELTLMHCYTCHHSLTEKQWKSREYGGRPGELRLNTSSLTMVREALQVINPTLASSVDQELTALHAGYKEGKGMSHAAALQQLMGKAMAAAEAVQFGDRELREVMHRIASYGAATQHPQYEVAEQIAMAIQSIASTISADGSFKKAEIDKIYANLKDPEAFVPDGFTAACAELAASFKG